MSEIDRLTGPEEPKSNMKNELDEYFQTNVLPRMQSGLPPIDEPVYPTMLERLSGMLPNMPDLPPIDLTPAIMDNPEATRALGESLEGVVATGTALISGLGAMGYGLGQIVNQRMRDVAQHGPFGYSGTPPNFYKNLYTEMEKISQDYTYVPRSELGRGTFDLITAIPAFLGGVNKLLSEQGKYIGLNDEQQKTIRFALDVALMDMSFKAVGQVINQNSRLRRNLNSLRNKMRTMNDEASIPQILKESEEIENAVNNSKSIKDVFNEAKKATESPSETSARLASERAEQLHRQGFSEEQIEALTKGPEVSPTEAAEQSIKDQLIDAGLDSEAANRIIEANRAAQTTPNPTTPSQRLLPARGETIGRRIVSQPDTTPSVATYPQETATTTSATASPLAQTLTDQPAPVKVKDLVNTYFTAAQEARPGILDQIRESIQTGDTANLGTTRYLRSQGIAPNRAANIERLMTQQSLRRESLRPRDEESAPLNPLVDILDPKVNEAALTKEGIPQNQITQVLNREVASIPKPTTESVLAPNVSEAITPTEEQIVQDITPGVKKPRRSRKVKEPSEVIEITDEELELDMANRPKPKLRDIIARGKDDFVTKSETSNPLEPTPTTVEDKLIHVENANKRVDDALAERLFNSLETGEDIRDLIPTEMRDSYIRRFENHQEQLRRSEKRTIKDMFDDVLEIMNPGRRTPQIRRPNSELGGIGRIGFTHSQKMALQRLYQDAARLHKGTSRIARAFYNSLIGAGLSDAQAKMGQSYIESIDNPLPPDGLTPTNLRMETNLPMKGDRIVKQRKIGNVPNMPVYLSENILIQGAKNVARPPLMTSFENPYYFFRDTDLLPIYYAWREKEKVVNTLTNELKHDIAKLKASIGKDGERAIAAHFYEMDPKGKLINQRNNIVPRALTPNEQGVADILSQAFSELAVMVNETRAVTGRQPLDILPNYFTLARDMSIMERYGLKPNLSYDKKADVDARFADYANVHFPYEKRSNRLYKANYNAFDIFEQYATTAIRDSQISPVTAKVHELINTKLPPLRPDGKDFEMQRSKPDTYQFLHDWNNDLTGRRDLVINRLVDGRMNAKAIAKVLGRINANITSSTLGLSIQSALSQLAAIPRTVHSIGPQNTAYAMGQLMKDGLTGGGMWEAAMKESNVLNSRGMGQFVNDFSVAMRMGRHGRGIDAFRGASMALLRALDSFSAVTTYIGAKRLGEKIGLTGKDLINFADDKVVMTQGSTMPGDVSKIQRTALGKFFTIFQQYGISDYNYLINEVGNLGGNTTLKGGPARRILTLLFGMYAYNTLMQDVLGISTPFPTPIEDMQDALARYEGSPALTQIAASTIALGSSGAAMLPIIGSGRFGNLGGAGVSAVSDVVVPLFQGRDVKRLGRGIARITGVPGAVPIMRSIQKSKREGGPSVLGAFAGRRSRTEERERMRGTGTAELEGSSGGYTSGRNYGR